MFVFRFFVVLFISIVVHVLCLSHRYETKKYTLPFGNYTQTISLHLQAVSPQPLTAKETLNKNIENIKKKVQVEPKKIFNAQGLNQRKIEEKKKKRINVARLKKRKLVSVNKKPLLATNKQKKNKLGVNRKMPLLQKVDFESTPVAPLYPWLAKRNGIQGSVIYEVWLDEEGQQIKLFVYKSSGQKILDRAARIAIEQWKFSPQIVDGKKIAHRLRIPIRFNLES